MSHSYHSRGRSRQSYRSSRPTHRPQPKRQGIDIARYVSEPVVASHEEEYQANHTFADFGLHRQVLTNIVARNYQTPTPIQDQAIPALVRGKDVVGIANTGTGKTAAFLLPLINKIVHNPNQGVLILAPTRELALQIHEEFNLFAKNIRLGVALCIGGTDIAKQVRRLISQPHFVIATPGRLKDLLDRGAFKTEQFTTIVLDEVDRMLDIGFRKDILFLISKLPQNRHAAFFSATMSREVEEIMNKLLTNPVVISVKKQETTSRVHQDVVTIKQGESKVDVLHTMLQQDEFERVIVFGRTKHGINKLEKQLSNRGIRVSAIHGNKSQGARQRSLQAFKQGRVQALLATDVAARGLDIDGVTHVINFDEPTTYEDYVHRIGRTGRAEKIGKALTFVSR